MPLNGSPKLPDVLKNHYVGEYDIHLKYISCTTLVRPTSERGLNKVRDSIIEQGWLRQFAPSVVIPRESMGDDGSVPNLAEGQHVRVLDGNHRVTVCKKLFGEDATLNCRVYSEFGHSEDDKVIANAFNIATESMAERTTYDKLFFMNELILAVQKSRNKKDCSIADITDAYGRIGAKAPAENTLRQWRKACMGMSSKAFEVARAVSESEEKGVDPNALTFAYLARKQFLDMQERPTHQAMCLQIIARFKSSYGKAPKPADFPQIEQEAEHAGDFMEGINDIVPYEKWTPALRREAEKLAFVKVGACITWLKPHVDAILEEIMALEAKLPVGCDEEIKTQIYDVLWSKPLERIEKIMEADADLRAPLKKWQEKYQETKNMVNRLELTKGGSSPLGGCNKNAGDDNESNKNDANLLDNDYCNGDNDLDDDDMDSGSGKKCPGKDARKGVLCPTCKPPASAKYHCDNCGMVHLGGGCCDSGLVGSEEDHDISDKRRRCKVCSPASATETKKKGKKACDRAGSSEQPVKKKARKTTSATVRPLALAGASNCSLVNACRAESIVIHDEVPLAAGSATMTGGSLSTKCAAKLVVVSIGGDKTLLKPSTATDARLNKLFQAVKDSLHPHGTVAIMVPHPWHLHAGRIHSALTHASVGLHVEDHPLLLQYKGMRAGRISQNAVNHLRYNADMVMLAHNDPVDGAGFTCNKRVLVDDPNGNNSGPVRAPLPLMCDIPVESAKTDIPPRCCLFLVNRYSNIGDTVISLGAESNQIMETALDRARKVEVFLGSSDGAREEVARRAETAFLAAYKEGKFQASSSPANEVLIRHGILPDRVPADTTPAKIKAMVAAEVERQCATLKAQRQAEINDGLNTYELNDEEKHEAQDKAAYKINETVTLSFGYTLASSRSSSEEVVPSLHSKEGESYSPNDRDLPVWGHFKIFTSRQQAFDSLPEVDSELPYVRLLHVANNEQLKSMLLPGVEVCSANAELYLEIAASCPVYYAMWNNARALTQLEVTSAIPPKGSRETLLSALVGAGDTNPLTVKVYRNICGTGRSLRGRGSADTQKKQQQQQLFVFPGPAVVRADEDFVNESDSSCSSHKHNKDDQHDDEGEGEGQKQKEDQDEETE